MDTMEFILRLLELLFGEFDFSGGFGGGGGTGTLG